MRPPIPSTSPSVTSRLTELLTSAGHDLRHAVRALVRRPGFTAAAALVLAVGIGASTALWSAVRALLLAPPPAVTAPEELVEVGRGRRGGGGFDTTSYPNFRDLRRHRRSLEGLAAYTVLDELSLTVDGDSERVFGSLVSVDYFQVLGVRPARGRLFPTTGADAPTTDGDSEPPPGAAPWLVVSHGLWQRRFGGDPDLVGRQVQLNGAPFTVVGVAPEGFRGTFGPVNPEVFVPMAMQAQAKPGSDLLEARTANWLLMVGRLRSGVAVEQARADLRTAFAAIRERQPSGGQAREMLERQTVAVAPVGAIHPAARGPVAAFLGALLTLALLVLAVAASNVSGLLAARAWSRGREMAVRIALGAGRRRLLRQLLTETAVLFLLGGAGGLGLALATARALPTLLGPVPIPVELELPMDPPMALFALTVALAAALVFGLAPALAATRAGAAARLQGGAVETPAKSRLRGFLVSVQVALSLVLLIAGGLLVRSLGHAHALDPGFEPAGVSLVRLDLALAGYAGAGAEIRGRELQRRLLERARAQPGVETAALAADLPLDFGGMGLGGIRPANPGPAGETLERDADFNVVTPAYFEVLQIPLVAGRGFLPSDDGGAERVAVINERVAETLWPGEQALGKGLRVGGSDGELFRVVGIARDGKYRSLGEDPRRYVLLPLAQTGYRPRVSLLVRSETPGVLADLRALVRQIDPRLPVLQATTLERMAAGVLLPQRVASGVAGLSGLVGLVLTVVGLWGLVAYSVSRRTREVGVRMALGAGRGDVLRLVLGGILGWVLGGLVAGLGLTLALSPALRSLVLGIPAVDPVTYLAVSLLLLAVAGVAAWLPARRALAVDPVAALRVD